MASLSVRLEERHWLRDWPSQVIIDFDTSEKKVGQSDMYPRLQRVVAAAFSNDDKREAVSIQEINAMLDRIEAWNSRHASALTWPPTEEGFLKALKRDIQSGHDDLHLMRLLVPQTVSMALGYSTSIQAPVASPASDQPTVEMGQPSSNGAAKPAIAQEKPRAPPIPPPCPKLAMELLEIVKQNPGGIASEKIDASIKSMVLAKTRGDASRMDTARFKFFINDLMPSMATLEPSDLSMLMACWPSSAAVAVARPGALLSRPDFWVNMKAGGPESRIAMMSEALPRLLDGSSWTPEQSLEALQKMMERVRSPAEFSRRLDLWHAWGGNLDAPIIAPDNDASDDFSTPMKEPLTARSWVIESLPSFKDSLPSLRKPSRGP